MAVVPMQKVQLLGMKKDLRDVMSVLQKKGIMEVVDITSDEDLENITAVDHHSDYDVANIDFALTFLKDYAPKRPLFSGKPVHTAESALGTLNSFDYKSVVQECQNLEEAYNATQNQLTALAAEEELLNDWKHLPFSLDTEKETGSTRIFVGQLPATEYDAFREALSKASPLTTLHKVQEALPAMNVVLAVAKSTLDEVKMLFGQFKFTEVELPEHDMSVSDRLHAIKDERKEQNLDIKKHEVEFTRLSSHYENLEIVHDVFLWQQEEQRVSEKLRGTHYGYVITGWMPKNELNNLEDELGKISKSSALQRIKAEEGEEAPILLHNKAAAWPFESVTKLYGFPMAHEVDPTPFLATFFIVFFGLCLTDFGYGLMLFVIMGVALKFFNLPQESKGLVKLLMWGGLVTMGAGILFGGYWGITPEQAPGFLLGADGQFKFQLINATSGNGPLTFLILALSIGVVHVLFGKLVDGWWKIKHGQYLDALFDSFLWIYFILAIIGFGLASTGTVIPAEYADLLKWLTIGGVIALILTQGRSQKTIVGKLGLGVLSLYGLAGYLGDVLSYSRLMALGLGTGIIAFAMNTIAGLALELIPYVGFIFAFIVLIIGHLLNLVLSALGAFIHSARLQFVEFFGKFMEGGGAEFKPFKRHCKYIIIQ